MSTKEHTIEINTLVIEDAVQDLKASATRNNKKLKVENPNKITIRHEKNNRWLFGQENQKVAENSKFQNFKKIALNPVYYSG